MKVLLSPTRSMILYTAAKTAQYNSDARFAIQLLKNAVQVMEKAGQAAVTEEHVKEAFGATRKHMELDVVERLSVSQLLVLGALARTARGSAERFLTLNSVHKGPYRTICEKHGRKPLVYSQFLTIVSGRKTPRPGLQHPRAEKERRLRPPGGAQVRCRSSGQDRRRPAGGVSRPTPLSPLGPDAPEK